MTDKNDTNDNVLIQARRDYVASDAYRDAVKDALFQLSLDDENPTHVADNYFDYTVAMRGRVRDRIKNGEKQTLLLETAFFMLKQHGFATPVASVCLRDIAKFTAQEITQQKNRAVNGLYLRIEMTEHAFCQGDIVEHDLVGAVAQKYLVMGRLQKLDKHIPHMERYDAMIRTLSISPN